MHHFAIGLCDLSAVSRRSRQATAEAKSRPFYNPDPFALQFRRKFLCKSCPDRVVLTARVVQVEQESSLIGTRTLTVSVVAVAIAGYFLIRTWLLDPRCKT
jgi:hypothetical protein